MGSRAAAKTARNLKEPNLGSKLRQGDPISKSIYDKPLKKGEISQILNEDRSLPRQLKRKVVENESPKETALAVIAVHSAKKQKNNKTALKKDEIAQLLNDDVSEDPKAVAKASPKKRP